MSHPDPLHDPENVYPHDSMPSSPMHRAIQNAINKKTKEHKRSMSKQYKKIDKAGRKVTGSWDGELIHRPKTLQERYNMK